jgi:hypothetical protein
MMPVVTTSADVDGLSLPPGPVDGLTAPANTADDDDDDDDDPPDGLLAVDINN